MRTFTTSELKKKYYTFFGSLLIQVIVYCRVIIKKMGCLKLRHKEENPNHLRVIWKKNEKPVKKFYNYYPGGMLQPGRNYNPGDYRYSYNGFEKDDEIKGVGNHISWGDYGYDPRTLRRFTPDKLQAKYPWQSPYAPVANNPVLNREIDGKDYSVYVNHDTKTIIVKAVYYTQKGNKDSHNEAVQATQFWNDQSGKFQYKVGKGKEAQLYNIQFNLSVQEVDDPVQQANKDRATFLPESERLTPDQSSNIFGILPDTDEKFISDDPTKEVSGVTEGGVIVNIRESRKGTSTGRHEVGHTLGFGHLIETIMSEASNVGRRESVNRTVVGQVLKNASLGKRSFYSDYQGEAIGTLQPSEGTAPSGFESGKVIRKKDE